MSSARHRKMIGLLVGCVMPALGMACAQDPNGGFGPGGSGGATDMTIPPVGPPMTGLRVVGNQIQNADGGTVIMRGVNRSGSEYMCARAAGSGGGFFDGPADLPSIAVMAKWRINTVRVPLNEACWLGINGVQDAYAGENYKREIVAFVNRLHQVHIVPILDLHWVGPGTSPADRLQPMPDADHAPSFWADVAQTFLADDGVVFELFNEPFPDGNRDSAAAWTCWRDGCLANQSVPRGMPAQTFQAAGMQQLVTAVRETGSKNLILLGGLQYSNALTGWLEHAPADPLGNLAAAWHVYNFNQCSTSACWMGVPATLKMSVPIVVTEFGENTCGGSMIKPFLDWNDTQGIGYLAWTWNTWGACTPPTPPATQGGRPWALITDFATGLPNSGYAMTYYDHLMGL